MKNKLKEIVEEIFNEDIEKISSYDSLQDLDDWDSLTYVRLVTTIQNSYSVELTKVQIQNLTSVGGIIETLKAHGIDA